MTEAEGILVTGLTDDEDEAIHDFMEAHGIGSLSEALRDLCRAGLAARRSGPARPAGAFRWVDAERGMVEAHCGGIDIGWVLPVEDERGVVWRITAVSGSKYLPPVSGNATSVESAKVALREAWTRWLADRSLGELVPEGAGAPPAA